MSTLVCLIASSCVLSSDGIRHEVKKRGVRALEGEERNERAEKSSTREREDDRRERERREAVGGVRTTSAVWLQSAPYSLILCLHKHPVSRFISFRRIGAVRTLVNWESSWNRDSQHLSPSVDTVSSRYDERTQESHPSVHPSSPRITSHRPPPPEPQPPPHQNPNPPNSQPNQAQPTCISLITAPKLFPQSGNWLPSGVYANP